MYIGASVWDNQTGNEWGLFSAEKQEESGWGICAHGDGL